eukprot:Gb_21085 [translate_table: standard]
MREISLQEAKSAIIAKNVRSPASCEEAIRNFDPCCAEPTTPSPLSFAILTCQGHDGSTRGIPGDTELEGSASRLSSTIEWQGPNLVFRGHILSCGKVNHRTHRGRPVRRYISGQSSTATWEWLETKRGQWHEYSDRLTSKFEAAWMGCTTSRTHNKKDCPAGLFFRLNGQAYSILFEADGIQCNLKTSSCRSIRRCTYLLNQMSSSYDQNLNLDTNSANYNSSLEAEWQWRTNDLHWRSYSHACSASIEAAFADGRPSVEINVFQDSSPTHLVYFENQTLVQDFGGMPLILGPSNDVLYLAFGYTNACL